MNPANHTCPCCKQVTAHNLEWTVQDGVAVVIATCRGCGALGSGSLNADVYARSQEKRASILSMMATTMAITDAIANAKAVPT